MADGVMTKNLLMWAVANIRNNAFYIGRELNMSKTNGQDDTMSNDATIMERASREWIEWADANDICPTNTTPETYTLMSGAFIDGYVNGFVKRFTEGE